MTPMNILIVGGSSLITLMICSMMFIRVGKCTKTETEETKSIWYVCWQGEQDTIEEKPKLVDYPNDPMDSNIDWPRCVAAESENRELKVREVL